MILKDPYRLFFPIGIIFSIVGVLPWLGVKHLFPYLIPLHKTFMINGFILSFVCGFLMTAIPRFTDTKFAKIKEVIAIFLFLATIFFAGIWQLWSLHYFAVSATLLSLVYFAAKRFIYRKSNPPYTFLFVGVSLIMWLLCSLLVANSHLFSFKHWLLYVAYGLINHGVVLGLIYGVGGRLIPGILGWEEIVQNQRSSYERPISFWRTIPLDVVLVVIIFFGSFVLEAFWPLRISLLFRALIAVYIGMKFWRLYCFPKTKSYLTWSVWLGAWSIVGGQLLLLLVPRAGINALHVTLVAGFGLLTFLISTRVIRAHSHLEQSFEVTTKTILIFAFLLILAMATRVSVFWFPELYISHLRYAAYTWLGAIVLWLIVVGRYMWSAK